MEVELARKLLELADSKIVYSIESVREVFVLPTGTSRSKAARSIVEGLDDPSNTVLTKVSTE